MNIAYGMTPESYRSYNNWHWIIGAILAALLLLLPWLTNGRVGPSGWSICAAKVAPVAVAPVAVPPAPAAPVVTAPAPAPAPAPVAVAPVEPPKPVVVVEEIPSARVYFALDRFGLPGDVGQTLAKVVAYLKVNPGAKGVISGFHDPQGRVTKEYNEQLAQNRAREVRGAMQRAGIALDRIVMEKPQETTGSGSNDEARRVEVTIQR
jgi:outer membrane protein OmpA-like peptidoglycan-associated protein